MSKGGSVRQEVSVQKDEIWKKNCAKELRFTNEWNRHFDFLLTEEKKKILTQAENIFIEKPNYTIDSNLNRKLFKREVVVLPTAPQHTNRQHKQEKHSIVPISKSSPSQIKDIVDKYSQQTKTIPTTSQIATPSPPNSPNKTVSNKDVKQILTSCIDNYELVSDERIPNQRYKAKQASSNTIGWYPYTLELDSNPSKKYGLKKSFL